MTSPPLTWWRAELLSDQAELASSALWTLGAGGVEIRDAETFFLGDPNFAPVPDGGARLVAFFEGTADQHEATADRLEGDARWSLVSFAAFEDESWKTKWKAYFKPRALSPRFAVGPPWEPPQPPRGGWGLTIEPGMAFGTGTHETTQLVAGVLDAHILEHGPPEAMLDVGSGSGILSIQAAMLGVPRVVGLDLDDDTVANAHANLALNDISREQVSFFTHPLADHQGTYPLVVANILAHILVELATELIGHTAPGGTLILSGILQAQLPQIRRAFGDQLQEVSAHSQGPWQAVVYRR